LKLRLSGIWNRKPPFPLREIMHAPLQPTQEQQVIDTAAQLCADLGQLRKLQSGLQSTMETIQRAYRAYIESRRFLDRHPD
jgi:hypothetical protein